MDMNENRFSIDKRKQLSELVQNVTVCRPENETERKEKCVSFHEENPTHHARKKSH